MLVSQLGERQYLEHTFQHSMIDAACKHCVREAKEDPEAARGRGASGEDRLRLVEIDIFIEALDSAIDYKQVGRVKPGVDVMITFFCDLWRKKSTIFLKTNVMIQIFGKLLAFRTKMPFLNRNIGPRDRIRKPVVTY
jgi:hypothetical protein